MKLNAKGKLAKFYMLLPLDDQKLPQDLCTFFWGLVGRAFFIFGMGGMLLAAILFAVFQAGLFVWAHKLESLFFLSLGVFAGLVAWLSERKKELELFSETRQIIKAKVTGVKSRYCPRIDWK